MSKYAPCALSHRYNMEKEGGGQNVKIGDAKLTSSTKQFSSGSVAAAFVHDCSFQKDLS